MSEPYHGHFEFPVGYFLSFVELQQKEGLGGISLHFQFFVV